MNDQNVTKFTLTSPQNGTNAGAYHLSVATELSRNYVAGLPVDGRHSIVSGQDTEGYPIVFSVGSDGDLYVLYHSEGSSTGWEQNGLRDQLVTVDPSLGSSSKAKSVSLSQNRDGTLYLAAVMSPSDGTADRLYFSYPISNDIAKAKWSAGDNRWVCRPHNFTRASIAKINLGTSDDGQGYPLALVVVKEGIEETRYFVNTDPNVTQGIWSPYPIPHNADQILDVVVGTYGRGRLYLRGTYALYTVGNETTLSFTSLPNDIIKQPIYVNYKEIPGSTQVVATLLGADGKSSDVYIGGSGLQVCRHGETSFKTVIPHDDSDVVDIIVSEDGTNLSAWVLTQDQKLLYAQGNLQDGTWGEPVPLMRDILQIAPIRDREDKVNRVVLVSNDGQLQYMWQDRETTNWTVNKIAIHSTASTLTFNSYVSTVRVTNNDGTPAGDVRLGIYSSTATYLLINGRTYSTSPKRPAVVTPDAMGYLRIIIQTNDLSCPTLRITSEIFPDAVLIRPETALFTKLSSLSDNLTEATYRHGPKAGQKVFKDVKSSHLSAIQAALRQLSALPTNPGSHAILSNDVPDAFSTTKLDVTLLPQNYVWGVQANSSTVTYHQHDDAKEIISGLVALTSPVLWIFGDALMHFIHYVEKDNQGFFFYLTPEGFLKLLTYAGKSLAEAVVDEVEQLIKLPLYIIKQFVDIDVDGIMDWIGHAFDWDDILITKSYLVNVFNDALDVTVKSTHSLGQEIGNAFDYLNKLVESAKPLQMKSASESASKGLENPQRRLVEGHEQADKMIDLLMTGPFGLSQIMDYFSGEFLMKYFFSEDHRHSWVDDLESSLMKHGLEGLVDSITNIQTTVEKMSDDLDAMHRSQDVSLNTMITEIGLDGVQGALNSIKIMSTTAVEMVEDLEVAFRAAMNEPIDIPVLSALYREATGNDLTFLDTICLAVAIPTTVMYKMIFHDAPFTNESRLHMSALSFSVNRLIAQEDIFADEALSKISVSDAAPTPFSLSNATNEIGGQASPTAGEFGASYALAIAGIFLSATSLIMELTAVISERTIAKAEGQMTNMKWLKRRLIALTFSGHIVNILHTAIGYPVIAARSEAAQKLKVTSFAINMFLAIVAPMVRVGTKISIKEEEVVSVINDGFGLVKRFLGTLVEDVICIVELEEASAIDDDKEKANEIANSVMKGLEAVGEFAGSLSFTVAKYVLERAPKASAICVGVGTVLSLGVIVTDIARVSMNICMSQPHHRM